MPIRTNSKIQNFTYGQIDKHLKEKQNNINEGEEFIVLLSKRC